MSNDTDLKNTVEAALLASGKPLSLDVILSLFLDEQQPARDDVRDALEQLQQEYDGRGIEIVEVASGWRVQVRKAYSVRVSRLWEEKPGRYSRAMLETLALIAYRQPITRGEIEEIRGVAVSSNIVKTMLERDWVQVVGQRDVPGRPSLYATTREFLDYFGLKGLGDLPTLADIKDLDELNRKLNLSDPDAEIEKADAANAAVLNADYENMDAPKDAAEAETPESGSIEPGDGTPAESDEATDPETASDAIESVNEVPANDDQTTDPESASDAIQSGYEVPANSDETTDPDSESDVIQSGDEDPAESDETTASESEPDSIDSGDGVPTDGIEENDAKKS